MLIDGAEWGVAELADVTALCEFLGMTPWDLERFADVRSFERTARHEAMRNYRYRWIAKRSGGVRLIEAPKPILAHVQRTLLRNIVGLVPPHSAAHGFVRGRSVVTAARLHVGADVVVRLDLDAFFATVPVGRVFEMFRSVGYRRQVAHLLTALMTNTVPASVLRLAPNAPTRRVERLLTHVHLPQGAPTSPAVANLAAFALDRRMAALAETFDATYTRYADDMTLSGGAELRRGLGRCLRIARTIIVDEGFRLNDRKTMIMSQSRSQRVLGVVVNERLNPPRCELDRLRAELHEARTKGPTAANRRGVADYRSHLQGRIEWIRQLNSDRATKLQTAFDDIDWGR